MNTAVIGLGSNINPEENISKARIILSERFDLMSESSFIQTKAIGYTNQDDFINGSVKIRTELTIEKLNILLKEIEKDLGRVASSIKCGPRTIDLDIVVYNGTIIDKDFYDRDFLKNSTLELIPDLEY